MRTVLSHNNLFSLTEYQTSRRGRKSDRLFSLLSPPQDLSKHQNKLREWKFRIQINVIQKNVPQKVGQSWISAGWSSCDSNLFRHPLFSTQNENTSATTQERDWTKSISSLVIDLYIPRWSNQCQYQLEPYQPHQVPQARRETQSVAQASSYL